jgi:hypothetical protein
MGSARRNLATARKLATAQKAPELKVPFRMKNKVRVRRATLANFVFCSREALGDEFGGVEIR